MSDKETKPNMQPVAIVGIGCLFPKANNLAEYWSNIRAGVDAITAIPATHWNPADYFAEDQGTADMTYAKQGGFIDPQDFNPLLYGLSPNNIEATDTTQLLGMVVARQALLDAAYATGKGTDDGREFDRDRASVIMGITGTLELVIPLGARLGHPIWRKALKNAGVDPQTAEEVVQGIADAYVPWQENSFPGLLGNVVAGRIANRFDLGGTNCVVDAACASSLSAIHLAMLELNAGRADMVITGGMDTFNDIFMYMCFSKTPALSPTGNSRPFAKEADGTILGEGLGAVILKRLEDAQRDGDKIYAVLKGMGASSDGRGHAVYAPSAEGQKKALLKAYDEAGVRPRSIELVEAHGTGTAVGDTVEATALSAVYSRDSEDASWCAVGSVKSMIGHTKAAAGVAGLIKAAMALKHKVLPPSIKAEEPLEMLKPGAAPIYLNTIRRPWLKNQETPRRAALSALGFGGSNFHCLLEEAEATKQMIDWDGQVLIIALSAADKTDLIKQLPDQGLMASWDRLRRFAFDSCQRFDAGSAQRLSMVIEKGSVDLAALLIAVHDRLAQGDEPEWQLPGVVYSSLREQHNIAFAFPGQGSQYVGMGGDLLCQFPQAFAAMEEANHSFRQATGESLGNIIYPIPVFSEADRQQQEAVLRCTQNAQAAIAAISLAALRVLRYFGVEADSTLGHSYGELVALHAAAYYDSEALHYLSRIRGELMNAGEGDRGSMLAVMADREQICQLLEAHQIDLLLANHNAPAQVVLSGARDQIDLFSKLAETEKIRAIRLPVAAAFHSPFVAAAAEPFAEAIAKVAFQKNKLPVLSNTTAAPYPNSRDEITILLAEQLANPVRFVEQIERLYAEGTTIFIEIGPGKTLSGLIAAILPDKPIINLATDASAGKQQGQYDLARLLATLAAKGIRLDLDKWDDCAFNRQAPDTDSKPAMTIPISGANVMQARPTKVDETNKPRAVMKTNTPQSVNELPGKPDMPQAQAVETNMQLPDELPGKPDLQQEQAVTTRPNHALLQATQESILALQKMQEQTARLHQQYLDGQETAQKTIQGLLEQQQRLMAGQAVTSEFLNKADAPEQVLPSGKSNPGQAASISNTHSSAPEQAIPSDRSNPGQAVSIQVLPSNRSNPGQAASISNTHSSAPEQAMPSDRSNAGQAVSISKADSSAVARQEAADQAGLVREIEETRQQGDVAVDNLLLTVVSEKTGYPLEMLSLDMSLDTDLGIDSIKRVEILSALQERLPWSASVNPEELGTFQFLQHIVEFIVAGKPASPLTPEIGDAPAATAESVPDFKTVLLEIVAEKTGYPLEMLSLDMQLDADLGIDSIKRVEILSAMQEAIPGLATVNPEELGRLQSLNAIIELFAADAISVAPEQTRSGSNGAFDDFAGILLGLVAEKTGYPLEMLSLDMQLDADLGIDSIKRVEILSAMQETIPDLATVSPDTMNGLQTLQAIVDLFDKTLPVPAATSAMGDALSDVLLAIVADKTGYPLEMLSLDMQLDADLGIDSIKRVEILSALQERLPTLPTVAADDLAALQTLQEIIAYMDERVGRAVPGPAEHGSERSDVKPGAEKESAVVRYSVDLVELNEGQQTLEFNQARTIGINEDGGERAEQLSRLLEQHGYKTAFVKNNKQPPENLGALVICAPAQADKYYLLDTFRLIQSCAEALKKNQGLLAAITTLGGSFGFAGELTGSPIQAGLYGMIKTADKEWHGVSCKAIDIDPETVSLDSIAQALFMQGPLELALQADSLRQLVLKESDIVDRQQGQARLNRDDLVVVTGGARGITAAIAVRLAETYRSKLLLIGRSPVPEAEPEWLQAVSDVAAIKQALLDHATEKQSPAGLEKQYQAVLAGREIRTTLQRIEQAGATVRYASADVADADAIKAVINQARRDLGAVSAVIHAAGILADRLIEDKTREQFDRVYATKVEGLENLLAATVDDDLKLIVLFSSTTARFGRKGQVDYAAANEILNKIAQRENQARKNSKILAVNWGPWDGGMVTPALKTLFEQEGIGVIDLQAGADYLLREIATEGPVETIFLAETGDVSSSIPVGQIKPSMDSTASKREIATGNAGATAPLAGTGSPLSSMPFKQTKPTMDNPAFKLAFERQLSPGSHSFLGSHVMNGQAVLPVAVILEWFAHGALHLNPGMQFHGFNDFRLFKGVTLDADVSIQLGIFAADMEFKQSLAWVPVELRSNDYLHASATMVLTDHYEKAGLPTRDVLKGQSPFKPGEYYQNGQLFHGRHLQGIRKVLVCSDKGIVAEVNAAPAPSAWMQQPIRSNWLADPLILDSAFQMMILWSFAEQGLASLPTAIAHYRQYQRRFPEEGARVVAEVNDYTHHRANASIEFIDDAGRLIAVMEGYECVRDGSLQSAFKENALNPEA